MVRLNAYCVWQTRSPFALLTLVCLCSLLPGIVSAQISFSLSGAFKNKTLNIGRGIDGKLSLSVQTDGDQALAMGGVRGKEGDIVVFDSNGLTKAGGYWQGLNRGTYSILLKAASKKPATPNADADVTDQLWLARSPDGRTITTRGPGGPEIMPLILQVRERPRGLGDAFAIVEVQGTVEWHEEGAISGKENLLRISKDGAHFSAITDSVIKDGAITVTAADGSRYKISAFSYDFSATVEPLEPANKVEPFSVIVPVSSTPANTRGDDLFNAATSHDLPRVKALLALGADVNAKNAHGATALFGASYYGNLDVVQVLLAKGADINARSNGATALFVASQEGHASVVQALLAKGADIDAHASDGRTALDAAKGGGHTDVMNLLVRAGAKLSATQPNDLPQPLSDMTTSPKTAPKPFLHQPQPVISPSGDTPANAQGDDIFNAAAKDDLPRVKALLAGGADENAKTAEGVTALMVAVKEGHLDVARALINADSDLNAKDKYGNTALIYASNRGQLETLRALLDAKAAYDARDNDGNSALIDASGRGQLAVVQELLARGANVNAASKDGVTPLIAASYRGDRAVIQVLLSKGAKIDAMTAKGVTALEAATQAGLADASALLSPSKIHSGGPDLATDASNFKNGAIGSTATSVKSTSDPVSQTTLPKSAQTAVLTNLGGMAQGLARFGIPGGPPVVRLHAVDGKGPADFGQKGKDCWGKPKQCDFGNKFKVDLIPGQHILSVGFLELYYNNAYASSMTWVDLSFVAISGHTYYIDCNLDPDFGKWTPYVVELVDKAHPSLSPATAHEPDLIQAASKGDLAQVEAELSKGAKVNAKDSSNWTALMMASSDGHLDVVRALLAAGADPNAQLPGGWTALMMASENGHIDVVRALIAANADFNARTNNGNTALGLASAHGHAEIKALLQAASSNGAEHAPVKTPF